MSSINDYIAASNNSVNDNKHNAQKARSKIHQIKQLLKPLIAFVKKNRKNSYKKSPQPSYFMDETADSSENDQNLANELLEQRIFKEIDCCPEYSGVPIYTSEGTLDVVPVIKGHHYIPVHFAKTETGTFFWTSMCSADSDICYTSDKYATEHQLPECQVPCDRWAQA